MGLISTEVEIGLSGTNIKRYESMGYYIPRTHNRDGKLVVKRGTRIFVDIKDIPNYCTEKIEVECDNCGEHYFIQYNTYTDVNHDGKCYCQKCYHKILLGRENSPRWKFDKTEEERNNQRCYPGYTEFVKKVLARDHYICQCCGKKISDNGIVHHLDGYNWCKEKRIDETNGITLCKNCHINFHMVYGKGNNTKEQFEEWIGRTVQILKYGGKITSTRQVFCLEENKVYDRVEDFAITHNIVNVSQIYDTCNRTEKDNKRTISKTSFRRITVAGKHLFWYDEYLSMTTKDWDDYWSYCENKHNKKVICLNTLKIYNMVIDATKEYNLKNSTSIISVCKGYNKSAGKDELGNPLHWMYYEDYLKLHSSEVNN